MATRSLTSWALLLAAFAEIGCGPSDSSGSPRSEDASASDAGKIDAANDGAVSPEGELAPGCPATVPQQGAPCSPVFNPPQSVPWSEPQACEYGTDPHCRTFAVCGPPWDVQQPGPSCNGNPSGCPAVFDAGAGGACPAQGSCTYAEGRCACVPCMVGIGVCLPTCVGPDGGEADSGSEWKCESWQPTPGCPEPRPRLGTPCAVEGQRCGGPGCFCNPIVIDPGMTCLGGYWNSAQGGC